MKKYLVKRVIHRLDGVSLATCVDPGSGRVSSLRYRTDGFDLPLIGGRMYLLRTAARSRGVNLVAAVECGIDLSAWRYLVENHFFVDDLQLKISAKRKLQSLNFAERGQLLNALTQNDMRPWRSVLHEPQSTLLGCAFQEGQQRYQSIKRLMSWGLSQKQAEHFYETHGADFCMEPLGRLKALLTESSSHQIRSAVPLTDTTLPCDHRALLDFMSWLREQGQRGRTLVQIRELPNGSGKALNLSAEWGWVLVDGEHCQLASHAMLQVAIRRHLERLASPFFPTYTPQEIQFSYSRYSQVIALHDHTELQEEVTAVINSRFSVVAAQDIPSICEFANQLSGTLQILYAPAPVVAVYSSAMLSAYAHCTECKTVPFFQLPADLADYTTIIMTDSHCLSLSDFLVALKAIPATSRVILIDQRPMLPVHPPHFLDDLKNYYQPISIPPQHTSKSQRWLSHQGLDHKDLRFDVYQAEQWCLMSPSEVFISDCPFVVAAINQHLRRVRSPVILETKEANFRKQDRIWLQPAYDTKWDPFICTIHSVSVKGLFVSMGDHYRILTAEFIEGATVSLAFATSPEVSVKAGARSAVLVVRASVKQAWMDYLAAYQVEVKQVYVHDQPQAIKATKMTYQRLAPLVE
ncbi:hypothetical protein ABNM01_20990 [Pseudomonas syringae]|uniref:hypothetical protein n=1 Tax=Pseudomonas syringae TaxID=317 RepID=UPI0032DC5ADF